MPKNDSLWSRRALLGFLGGCALLLGACATMQGEKSDTPPAPVEPAPTSITTRGPKKRIAVLRFAIKTTDASGLTGVDLQAAEMLTTALFKTGQFIVIERSLLDKVLQEQGLGQSGVVDAGTAAKLGQVLGVQALVTGAVTQLGQSQTGGAGGGFAFGKVVFEAALDVRAIDTTTARLLLADSGVGRDETTQVSVRGTGGGSTAERQRYLGNALRNAVDDVTQKLVAQLQVVPWAGRIADMSGGSIYINAGADLGLQPDTLLDVYRRGREIKDPVSRESLGFEEFPIGQLRLIDIKERFSIATVGVGAGFQQNDVVRLTDRPRDPATLSSPPPADSPRAPQSPAPPPPASPTRTTRPPAKKK